MPLRLLGESSAISTVRELIARIGPSDAAVLLTGETGTGKELVAQSIHERGSRASGPFVAINCAAMPETLLEAELFGHARGAFTDAKSSRLGLLVGASGGTLFLDEVGELPLTIQPKLLRALQERAVRPVGRDTEVSFDCRIIAATNRDLEVEVAEQRFRRDLFFRLHVLHVHLPPLRSRASDVLVLARHFIDRLRQRTGKRVVGFGDDVARVLLRYDWPGNVRELENAIECAFALARGVLMTLDDLPERIVQFGGNRVSDPGVDVEELCSLEEVERRHIERVLDAVGGNKGAAARVLNVDRSTLYRKLKRYGLDT
jgi:transcriptional regulator with PAS, ATPase and Fis domain